MSIAALPVLGKAESSTCLQENRDSQLPEVMKGPSYINTSIFQTFKVVQFSEDGFHLLNEPRFSPRNFFSLASKTVTVIEKC